MSLLQEVTFERLLPRYERTFGEPPPFRSATLDEVVEHMRHRLRAVENAEQRDGTAEMLNFALPRSGIPGPETTFHAAH